MFCFVNDKLTRMEEASLGIRDLSILRGYGIFDFFRLNNNVPLFMEDHFIRFFHSARQVFDEVPIEKEALAEKIFHLIGINKMPVSGIRIVLTGGYSADGYSVSRPNLIITQEPINFPDTAKYEQGVKLITYPYQRELPEIKTINYMTGIWMKKEISRHAAFDVLYHSDGKIAELTRSNFFVVTAQNQLVTPGNNILKGVTRKKVLEIAPAVTDVVERELRMTELKDVREAFLTGTTKKILPVTTVDDVTIADGQPGPVTRQLMALFHDLEEQYIKSK